MDDQMEDRALTELKSLERPHYFQGELLGVDDFNDEQNYLRHKSRLHNRLGHGPGVVCGLSVTPVITAQGIGVRISAGMALDAWGREILVPADVEIAPLRIFDGCALSLSTEQPLPSAVHLVICYRETPIHPAPETQLGTDRGQARSILETYCLRVAEGTAPDVSKVTDMSIADLLATGQFHEALCRLAEEECPPVSDDPCVVLANIEVGQDPSLTIDACRPRRIAPTNRLFIKLIASMRRVAK
jgi:hypothetical protein